MSTANDQFHLLSSLNRQQEAQIVQTLEATFARKVIEHYFDTTFSAIFANDSFTAVALLKNLSGYHYLDKFAIHPDRQNQGIGRQLWSIITRHTPELVWRAKKENPFNQFYNRHCSGLHHIGLWTIYWKDIKPENIPQVIELVSQIPESFYDKLA